MDHLESDLLRTFVAVADAGSMTDGAARVFRSQSATSLQIKRLETVLGQKVFERHGRGVVLTDAGRTLLPVAREVTARLDGALRDIAAGGLQGKLSVGIPDDHGRGRLARVVGIFARQHPMVELEVTCALSADFRKGLAAGRLDVAVYEVESANDGEEVLFEDPTCWAAAAAGDIAAADPLPVALFDRACWWRDAALASLRARKRPFRIVYSSQSVAGVTAAVEAGIAVGLLGKSSLGDGLAVLGRDHGFAPTPNSKLVLGARETGETRLVEAMKSAIRTAFRL